MATYNNNITQYPVLNTFIRNYQIDNMLCRTYFIYDVSNWNGHDIVYYNYIDKFVLEGECINYEYHKLIHK